MIVLFFSVFVGFLVIEGNDNSLTQKKDFSRTPSSISPSFSSQSSGSCSKLVSPLRSYRLKRKKTKKVRIAIIDTGFDIHNECLKNIYNPYLSKLSKGVKRNSHGTHIASIIASINPNVELVYFEYEASDLKSYLKALSYAVDTPGVRVINASLSGVKYSKLEDKIIKKADQYGIVIVAAAGNNGRNIDTHSAVYPAALPHPNILSVGASDDNGRVLSTSNYGQKNVDITARGMNIYGYTSHNKIVPDTGTSMAAAYISGIMALSLGLGYQIPEILEEIKNSADKNDFSKYGNFNEFLYASNLKS